MKYELIDKVKKFERTKGLIKSILSNQEESVSTMLDVIKSDGKNKLSTHRTPKLEEWKNVYTSMGWEYIEDRKVCISPESYSFKDSPILQDDITFNNNDKEKLIHPNSYYDEVVGNYETYSYCKQQVRQTQLILEKLKGDYFNNQLLDYDSINHDEALCFLLGINVELSNTLTLANEKLLSVYDYEADFYDVSINGLLFRSKEHQLLKRKFGTPTINTQEFIEWAVDKYIKPIQKNKTNSKTDARNKNIDKVKKSLLKYLPSIKKTTTKHNLSLNKDFHSILQENGLNVEEYGVDANKIKSKKHANVAPTSIDNYIEEILLSDWWNNNLETSEIRKKIRKPIKSKTKNN
jgi:hypothetical protein